MNKIDSIEVKVRNLDHATVASPQGEIDLSRATSFRQQIVAALAPKPKLLLIDLAEVPYMDSSGVATLLEMMQATKRGGGKLVLCSIQPKVRSIFEIARLETVFTIVATVEDGLKV